MLSVRCCRQNPSTDVILREPAELDFAPWRRQCRESKLKRSLLGSPLFPTVSRTPHLQPLLSRWRLDSNVTGRAKYDSRTLRADLAVLRGTKYIKSSRTQRVICREGNMHSCRHLAGRAGSGREFIGKPQSHVRHAVLRATLTITVRRSVESWLAKNWRRGAGLRM